MKTWRTGTRKSSCKIYESSTKFRVLGVFHQDVTYQTVAERVLICESEFNKF